MFKAQEAANILGIGKSTLLRYYRNNPSIDPDRIKSQNARRLTIDDIYRTYEHMQQLGTKGKRELQRKIDKDTLDRRIVKYALSIAVTEKQRKSEIIDTINPMLRKSFDLETMYRSYVRDFLL